MKFVAIQRVGNARSRPIRICHGNSGSRATSRNDGAGSRGVSPVPIWLFLLVSRASRSGKGGLSPSASYSRRPDRQLSGHPGIVLQ